MLEPTEKTTAKAKWRKMEKLADELFGVIAVDFVDFVVKQRKWKNLTQG